VLCASGLKSRTQKQRIMEPEKIGGGVSGMRDGEHKGQNDLSPNKFYVMARGRYKSFERDPNEDERDWRHELPVEAHLVWGALNDTLTERTMRKVTQDLNKLSGQNNAYASFVLSLWYPLVKQNLDAFNGLITNSEHQPMMHQKGSFCYDVKICRLMKRKMGSDMDINGDISKTRAMELLRILHTKIGLLPRSVVDILFKGLGTNAEWPQNEADEPFSAKSNEDFRFDDEYVSDNIGPMFKAIKQSWGTVLCIVKRSSVDEFEDTDFGQHEGDEADEEQADQAEEAAEEQAEQAEVEQIIQAAEAEAAEAEGPAGSDESPEAAVRSSPIANRTRARKVRGGLTSSILSELQGGTKHNRFGTRSEMEELEWISDGQSSVGLLRLRDGKNVVLAYVWSDTMPELLKGLKGLHVWFPPVGLGKSDGYFSNNEVDYEAMRPWVESFDVKPGSVLEKPKSKKHILTHKALMAGTSYESPPLEDFGLRGGHFLWIE
jgi:hypothetical protein